MGDERDADEAPIPSGGYQVLYGHTSDVTWCDFSSSKLLVSCSNDKTVRIWRPDENGIYQENTSPPRSPLAGHTYGVNCVRFSPFGTILVSGSTDGNIILWNAHTGQQVVRLQHPSNCAIRVCCFSASSAILATGGDDETLCLWDISTRTLVRCLKGHEAMITCCAFSPDSSLLISGSTSGDLKLWDSRFGQGKCLETAADTHDLGVLGCDFSSQYQVDSSTGTARSSYLLASCGNDDMVKLWLVRGGHKCSIMLSHVLEGHTANVHCCRFSNDGALLASASGDKNVIIWNPQTGELINRLEGHSRYVTCCVFSANNRILATGSNDKTVIVWNLDRVGEGKIVNGQVVKTDVRQVVGDLIDLATNASSVSHWLVADVAKWVEELGLEQYTNAFVENAIDGAELLHMSHDTLLTSLKIEAFGHRNKILRGVQALRNPLWQHLAISEDNVALPEELYCPITHEFMKEPVVASDGYTYEREAITEWFAASNSSPMTNEPLESQVLFPNLTLKLLINKYLTP